MEMSPRETPFLSSPCSPFQFFEQDHEGTPCHSEFPPFFFVRSALFDAGCRHRVFYSLADLSSQPSTSFFFLPSLTSGSSGDRDFFFFPDHHFCAPFRRRCIVILLISGRDGAIPLFLSKLLSPSARFHLLVVSGPFKLFRIGFSSEAAVFRLVPPTFFNGFPEQGAVSALFLFLCSRRYC